MATIDELRALAREIREERQIGGNTGERVGNTFDRVADLLESTGGDISDIREAVEQLLQDVGFIPRDVARTETDAVFTNNDGTLLFWFRAATDTLAGLITAENNNKLIALPTAEQLAQALAAKQNRLTFDPQPIEGSTNPVTSDGIYTAIANFITRSVSDLIYYYTKSETYNKEEVNALVAAIKQFVPVVAQTLPTASADTMYKLYLIPSEDPEEGNIKDEYITIDNGVSANPRYTWEKIGSADIDISGKADIGTVPADVTRSQTDATFVNNNNESLFYLSQATSSLAGLMTAAEHTKLGALPTAQDLNTKLEGTIYDISVLHPTSGVGGGNTYASLSAALAVIPQASRKGGMSVRFIHSYDNKYVQYRLMADAFTTTVSDWQSMNADTEPTAGSKNLVESGGVKYSENLIKLSIGERFAYPVTFLLNKFYNTAGTLKNSNGWACTELSLIEYPNVIIYFSENHLLFNIYSCYVYNNSDELLGSAQILGNKRYVDCESILTTYPTATKVKFTLHKTDYTTELTENDIADWEFIQYDKDSLKEYIDSKIENTKEYIDSEIEDVKEYIVNENPLDVELTLNSYAKVSNGNFSSATGWVRTDYITLPNEEFYIEFNINNSLEFNINSSLAYSNNSYLGTFDNIGKKIIDIKAVKTRYPTATRIVINLNKEGYSEEITAEDVTDFTFLIYDPNSIVRKIESAKEEAVSEAVSLSEIYADNKSLTTLNDSKDYTDERIDGIKNNVLHLSLNADTLSYIRTSFDQNKWIDLLFYLSRSVSMEHNPSLNFDSVCFTNKPSGTQTVIHGIHDEITPSDFNGTYIGANHGDSDIRIIPCDNHGKTYADIGSIWSCDGHQYTIVGIKDENNLYLLGENYKVYPLFEFVTPPSALNTFVHVSGATHTSDIVSTGTPVVSQYYPAYIVSNKKVIIDGVELTQDGDYNFATLNIVENYDIFNPASVLNILHQAVGTLTSNPTIELLNTADKVARHSIIYTFESSSEWRINTNFIAYQDIEFGYFGFTQQKRLSGSNLKLYIPKALPIEISGNNLDFRTIVNMSQITASVNLTSEFWENPLLPPDRWLSISNNIALHSGYLFDYGIGGTNRKNYVNKAINVNGTSLKLYPHGADDKIEINAGDVISAVVWRSYKNLSEINTGGIISKNCFEYNGVYYIYLDFNQSGVYNLNIPFDYIDKKIEVFEKSSNVTLLAELSNTDTLIKVDTASPMYGYLVAKISK